MKILVLLCAFSFSCFIFASERPDLEIKIKSTFICEQSRSLSGKRYRNFCKQNFSENKILYVLFDPSEKVIFEKVLSSYLGLGNIKGWCNLEINDGRVAPGCYMMAKEKSVNREVALSVTFLDIDNLVAINISTLDIGKSYQLRLVEAQSGSNASSMPFNIDIL